MKNWLKGWLGIGKEKTKGKANTVYAPIPDTRTTAVPGRGGMNANVVPSAGLEWMDEKNQK